MSKIYTVIAAGGLGKRLQNFRNSKKTKMLLEINGQSMITKQLNQLISWNLDNFIVITNPRYDKLIKDELSKNMSDLEIQYSLQNEQLGVAHALLQAEKFVPDGAKIIYILGDNFFEFNPLIDLDISKTNASIFLTKVSNPEEFGVVEVVDGEIISIQEKPSKPKSDYMVPHLKTQDQRIAWLDIYKEMQANPTTPAPDEMWFEDDPRAVKEIEYGRVIRRATTINSSTTLGDIFE